MKIVILDYKTIGVEFDLQDFGELTSYDTTLTKQDTINRTKDADIIITNKVILDEEVLRSATNLKLVAISATGINNIDLKTAKELGVAVANVAGYSTTSVVEHTLAMYFSIAKHMEYYANFGKTKWQESDIFTNIDRPFEELSGKKWGIVGLGTIGLSLANVLKAFGVNVCYYSTSQKNTNQEFRSVSFEDLLSDCDIVSIHAPLNDNTKNLFNYKTMSLMKKSAILLNLARGQIVNEKDLIKILKEEKIKAVGLDVLEKEPPLPSELFSQPRVLITPHVAWASLQARQRLTKEVTQNIESFLKGEPRNRVDL